MAKKRGLKRMLRSKRRAKPSGPIPAKLIPKKGGGFRVMVAKKYAARVKNPSTWGTSHFTSKSAAIRYYKDYGYDDVKAAVEDKIRGGEIHIGKPALKSGQRLILLDDGKRYGVTEG